MEFWVACGNDVVSRIVGRWVGISSGSLRFKDILLIKSRTNVEGFVSRSSLVPTAKGIDVIPGLFICKGDLVWSETNDLSIFFMKLSFTSDKFSGKKRIDERQAGGRPQLGTWELGKWVKVKIVDCLCYGILFHDKSIQRGSGTHVEIEQLTAETARRAAMIWRPMLCCRTATKSLSKAMSHSVTRQSSDELRMKWKPRQEGS